MSVQDKTTVRVPLVATEAMEQAAYEAAGSPSDWVGFQDMWAAALQAAEKECMEKRARKWPFGRGGPSPLHVACPACGAVEGEPCVTQFLGASHGIRFKRADEKRGDMQVTTAQDKTAGLIPVAVYAEVHTHWLCEVLKLLDEMAGEGVSMLGCEDPAELMAEFAEHMGCSDADDILDACLVKLRPCLRG